MSEKKLWQKIISRNVKEMAEGLEEFINGVVTDRHKQFARTAVNYYDGNHDIKRSRVFYVDQHGEVKEDRYTDIKIPHPFFMEIADQKVQYLLSKGVQFETDNQKLKERLEEYINEDFQLFVDKIVTGTTIKGAEYAYAKTGPDDRIMFDVSDYLNTETVLDDRLQEVAVVRYYDQQALINGRSTTVNYAEVYTDKEIYYFVKLPNNEGVSEYELNLNIEHNPRKHVMAVQDDQKILSRSYGAIPFYRLQNNLKEMSDLYPIKDLIDDYDIMSSFLSSNLQNYDRPITVIKGYQGDKTEDLINRIQSTGVVRVGAPNMQGDVDIRTYNVPFEGRKAKMEMDKEAIYKFGMAFDSTQLGDGNITNIVIKSRYSLLDLKCNKMEPRVRSMIKWCLQFILEDIKRLHGESYRLTDIEVVIERNMIFNENDIAEMKLKEAQTIQTLVGALAIASSYIDEVSIINKICEYFDLDHEEVLTALEDQSPTLEGDGDEQAEAE